MSRTYHLERQQVVARPLAEVFAFFADAGNLERLTPPSLQFQILSPQPIEMRPGAVIDYRLRLVGVPFRWRSVIEVYEPQSRFVHVQAKGPYKLWRHTHEFKHLPEGTLVCDRVEYQLPLGILGRPAQRLLVRRSLARIFDYRAVQLEKVFSSAGAAGPPASRAIERARAGPGG